ncbi:MAG: multifunctional oxoglutarate decarboxylase/oxoglutarate dehydrogenase thiamine pyrophosphate-binding subunit/dihydrolipoyllysine-residue succinyltransferase subunit [Gaiellaceae bacterium]
MAERRDVDGLNAGYAQLLLDDYLENPSSVPPEWRELFERGDSPLLAERPGLARLIEAARADGDGQAVAAAPGPVATPDEELVGGVAAAMALVKAYRTHGHLAARLDPLGSEPPGEPALDPLRYVPRLTPELQARIPAALLRLSVEGDTLAEAIPHLEETYCGTIAYELEHIADHEQRVWLRQAIESGTYRQPLAPEERRRLLERLTEVETFETFLRKTFLGQKQFSIEGLDVLVPMLDEAIELAAESGAHEIVLGMAHRGRLNVLAHTVGRPYDTILREFEGERTIEAVSADPEGGTGDVKYHLGARGARQTRAGEITVTLASNPSHLEAVDPVVEGITRSKQTDRGANEAVHEPSVALPVLIHGDASFAAQGVVAETLNLSALAGYSTGGTVHLIANNQVGFTTDPAEGRSTRYASDLAKGFDVPIVHVNADDPEAAIAAVRLAMAYRRRFGRDVVIDLVGYRRHGHNEQDEPAYTQPLMADRIARQPPVREQYAARVAEAGEADALLGAVQERLREAHAGLKEAFAAKERSERTPSAGDSGVDTQVPEDRLRSLNEELLRVPDEFTVHPKLARQLERRREALDEGGIDWGQAEALSLASLLTEGIPVRLTGQDTERGTFSHRHLVLHDAETGERYAPIQRLEGATAAFEVHNSPLSEFAALGFEYGYSIAAAEALVLWEAQFGDFVNGAQVIVDQFMVSGLSKWKQSSRLTLLLPHGYEGNGPEHSSARLERFLSLAAQENVRVANCSTAAQYFHLLRRQALDPKGRPLIVMTPKGLLRLKEASSTLAELSEGGFRQVIDDEGRPEKDAVRRLVLCSGKVYYDLTAHELRGQAGDVAVARLEQLYPFPVEAARELVAGYPALEEIVWAQEEPQNMGAWRAIRHRLEEVAGEVPVRYVGRPWRASPSEGYPTAHQLEQARILREALSR